MSLTILYIQSSLLHAGGASVAQRSMINASTNLGYSVYAITLDGIKYDMLGNRCFTKKFETGSSKFAKIGFNSSISDYIIKVGNEIKPDVVVVGNVWGYFAVISAMKKISGKKILVVHGAENFCLNSMLTKKNDLSECEGNFGLKCVANRCESPLKFIFKFWLHSIKNFALKNNYDTFIVHSRYMYKQLNALFPHSVEYIPLALERDENLKPSVTENHKVLFIGTLTWNKGIRELVEACNLLVADNITFKLNIVGDGEDKVRLMHYVTNNKLEKYIIFSGVLGREEIEEIILDSEIVVFPSFFESFGLVALEAMIASRKVITSNRGALPEITAKYPNVFYLKEITASDIAEKIKIAFKTPYAISQWDNPYTQTKMRIHLSKIFEGN